MNTIVAKKKDIHPSWFIVDASGKSLSGVSEGQVVTLRDERGNTWKGFVD